MNWHPADDPRVRIVTALGEMVLSIDLHRAPATAGYFLDDVVAGRFDGTSFYRIATGANRDEDQSVTIEVIQGGDRQPAIAPAPSLLHESTAVTGLQHRRGTISLARFEPGAVYHSFFLCGRDEPSLDFGGGRQPDGQGFPAFGGVISGFDVLDRLFDAAEMRERLSREILIERIELLEGFQGNWAGLPARKSGKAKGS